MALDDGMPAMPGPGLLGRVPAPLLVLMGIVSVQFGGALAATLVPAIGAAGSVTLRLLIGTLILLAVARPRLSGHSRRAWGTVVLFGLALGAMNWSFYASLGRLPIGVAVTIEFLGPLVLTVALSRRGPEFLLKGLGIAVLSSVLPYSFELFALRRMSSRVFGILLSLEPALAALAGYLVLHQRLTGLQLLGIALVVGASALVMGTT